MALMLHSLTTNTGVIKSATNLRMKERTMAQETYKKDLAAEEKGMQPGASGNRGEKSEGISPDAAGQFLSNVSSIAKKTYGNVEKAVEGAVESTEERIKSHPMQTLLIGVGVGVLVGLLFQGFRRAA